MGQIVNIYIYNFFCLCFCFIEITQNLFYLLFNSNLQWFKHSAILTVSFSGI